MNATTLLREAYPNALEGMFFRDASEEDLYRQYLTIMGNRLPAGDGHGLTTILRHEERTRFGRQMGPNLSAIHALKHGYTDDGFRELLIYLTGHTHYARDVQAIRAHFMSNNFAQPDARAAGDLAQLLQRYTGSDYVASGDTMQRFAKALCILAGGHDSIPYPRVLVALDTNVSSKVRPEIAKWAKGIYPCWGDILTYTEQQYGQPAVHDALTKVGLRKPRKDCGYRTPEKALLDQQIRLIEQQTFPLLSASEPSVQFQYESSQQEYGKLSFQQMLDAHAAPRRAPRTHAGLPLVGHIPTPSPAHAFGVRMHEALEKEQKTMPSITDQKPSPLKNTANKIKAAVQHGTAVASADEMANAALLSVAEVVPEIQPLLQTELGTTIVKLGLGSMIIGAVEHDFVPLENTDHLEKGATLVVEAAARDGLQPLMAKLTPILVKLAAAGKKAFDEASK